MNQDDLEEEHKNLPPTIEDKLNSMQTFVDQKEFVVIDNGTGFLKCGFSGEDLPRISIPTVMGVKEIIIEASQTNDQGGKKYSRIYGEKAQDNTHEYDVTYPIKRGVIEDFETMKYCWNHLLSHKNMHNQKKCNLLITDSPLNHKDNKIKMAEYLFDKLKDHNIAIDSLNIMNSSVLSLFASGRTSGIVVESGQGITTAVPIFEGYALPHAIKSINLAGEDVTFNLLDSLVSQGIEVDNSNINHIRKIKEQMCSVALDYDRAINASDPLREEAWLYELPDDKGIIKVDHKTRFNATELLFNPEIIGSDIPNIPQITYDSIDKWDQDLQITLFNNIVLTGGTSLLPGFKDRFEQDLYELAAHTARTDIKIDIDLPRRHSAWVGGSMIASLSTFDSMTIKATDYEENPELHDDAVLKKLVF